MIFDLRSDLYERLQRLPLRWFDNRPTGDIMTTVSEDIPAVERVLIDGIEQGVVAVLQILVVGAFLFQTDAKLAVDRPAAGAVPRRRRAGLHADLEGPRTARCARPAAR